MVVGAAGGDFGGIWLGSGSVDRLVVNGLLVIRETRKVAAVLAMPVP